MLTIAKKITLKKKKDKSIVELLDGTEISVTVFEKDGRKINMYAEITKITTGERVVVRMERLHKISNDFIEITEDMLTEAMVDARSESMTGETVEPDGYDTNGFPSVLMAMGMC